MDLLLSTVFVTHGIRASLREGCKRSDLQVEGWKENMRRSPVRVLATINTYTVTIKRAAYSQPVTPSTPSVTPPGFC